MAVTASRRKAFAAGQPDFEQQMTEERIKYLTLVIDG